MEEKIKQFLNLNTEKKINIYNILMPIFVWIFFIGINIVFWKNIVNFIFKFNYDFLIYIYILIIFPGLLSEIVYYLIMLNNKKKVFYIIILSLIIYYILFISLIIYVYINFKFGF